MTYRKDFLTGVFVGPNISSVSTIRVPVSHQWTAAWYKTFL